MNRPDKNGELIRYDFKPSYKTTIFKREVYTLTTALTVIGGLFSSLSLGGYMFVLSFSYKLFIASLVGKM